MKSKAIRAILSVLVLFTMLAPAEARPRLRITTQSLPTARGGTKYWTALQAKGGRLPYLWAMAQTSALPVGLTLSGGGVISGTPTVAGTSSFSVKVSDASSSTDTANLSLTVIAAPAPSISGLTSSLTGGTGLVLSPYAGGAIFTIAGQNFQPGARVQIGTAVVTPTSVTPTQIIVTSPVQTPATNCMAGPNISSFLKVPVQVANPDGQTAIASAALQPIYFSPAKILTTGSIPNPQLGVPYSFTLLATCGSGGPYNWSIVAGTIAVADAKILPAKAADRGGLE